jgi:hypothetical protein
LSHRLSFLAFGVREVFPGGFAAIHQQALLVALVTHAVPARADHGREASPNGHQEVPCSASVSRQQESWGPGGFAVWPAWRLLNVRDAFVC